MYFYQVLTKILYVFIVSIFVVNVIYYILCKEVFLWLKLLLKNPVPDIKEARKFIKFVTIAEDGAMGDSGSIEFFCRINGQNILYEGNRFYGKKILDYEKLKKDFPKLNYMNTFMLPCDYSFRGWKYFNLGCGNNLYISTSVYPYFKILTEYMAIHEVYKEIEIEIYEIKDSDNMQLYEDLLWQKYKPILGREGKK